MQENADIIFAKSETRSLLNSSLSLQKKGTSNRGKRWANGVIDIVDDIKQRVSLPLFDMDYAYRNFPLVYIESTNTVLIQELLRDDQLNENNYWTNRRLAKGNKGNNINDSRTRTYLYQYYQWTCPRVIEIHFLPIK